MKTKMKMFAAIALAMGFVSGAMAQSAVTGNVKANASVQTKLSVTSFQSLEFGTVDNVSGQSKTVSLLDVATSSGDAAGQADVKHGIGKIVRTGGAIITYKLVSPPTALAGPEGSFLPIKDFVTAYSSTEEGPQTSGSGTVVSETVVDDTTGNEIFVHIGATVTPSIATTKIGTHTADITLSAEYN